MSYQDKVLTCVDCGTQFVFTANEQAFYAERGFTNEPKRCGPCRQNRKASRASSGYGSDFSSGGDSSGAGGGYGGQRELHTVTCRS
ncbi:MAG: zinc-ribbon domain-containing protein, partial [Chloroflexota bacterium]